MLPGGVSVVVPVFNGEQTLEELVRRISAALAPIAPAYEIILVNDGSADGSWSKVLELAATDGTVRGIDLMRNSGQHNATLAGIRAARFAITVTLDDDLQNPPEEIPNLVRELEQGWDVVYGTAAKRQFGRWRNLATAVTKLALQTTMGAGIARQVSPYRAFRTRIRDAFEQFDGPHVSIDVLLTWGTSKFTWVRVTHDARTVGRSNYTFRSLLRHGLNMMTGFSTRPLQFASLMGFSLAFLGGVLFVYVVIRRMVSGTSVPGFAFLASIIAVFSGAQLFALGIVGEYIGRLHFRTMRQPSYVVREEVTALGGPSPSAAGGEDRGSERDAEPPAPGALGAHHRPADGHGGG
jgi:glycosyltransferase involved in cell wall biosynthesis